MLLLLLSYLGGVLTIFSPCVLPVVPFLFTRADQPFVKSGLPTLVGMALSFATIAAIAAAGGGQIAHLNEVGRIVAMAVFTVLGLSLVFASVAQRIMQPIVNLGGALQKAAGRTSGVPSSLLIGASVGLLWAPCAGPILGLVLAGAALGGVSQHTFALLFAFALGAASSLGIAIAASGKVMRLLKKGLGVEEYLKKGLGVVVLVAVGAIAVGADTKLLAKFSYLNTGAVEQNLIGLLGNHAASPVGPAAADMMGAPKPAPGTLADYGPMPALASANAWLNVATPAGLSAADLQNKVVLIDFWTYSCINCLRTLPYVESWSQRFKDAGLVVVGVHSPEFAFERETQNVAAAVKDLGVTYPVAVDSDLKIWTAFSNQYWPAQYLVDAKGHIRFTHFGEGSEEATEHAIQQLLTKARPDASFAVSAPLAAQGVEAAASDFQQIATPETYLGYERQEGYAGQPAVAMDKAQDYAAPAQLALNQWALTGNWTVANERIVSGAADAQLDLRFKARDAHLVLGTTDDKPHRIRVTLDGIAPGAAHGADVDAAGVGMISGQRLYQLIRQSQNQGEHVLTIQFQDSGAQAYAFTFG